MKKAILVLGLLSVFVLSSFCSVDAVASPVFFSGSIAKTVITRNNLDVITPDYSVYIRENARDLVTVKLIETNNKVPERILGTYFLNFDNRASRMKWYYVYLSGKLPYSLAVDETYNFKYLVTSEFSGETMELDELTVSTFVRNYRYGSKGYFMSGNIIKWW